MLHSDPLNLLFVPVMIRNACLYTEPVGAQKSFVEVKFFQGGFRHVPNTGTGGRFDAAAQHSTGDSLGTKLVDMVKTVSYDRDVHSLQKRNHGKGGAGGI